jgi:hypothetical protein
MTAGELRASDGEFAELVLTGLNNLCRQAKY